MAQRREVSKRRGRNGPADLLDAGLSQTFDTKQRIMCRCALSASVLNTHLCLIHKKNTSSDLPSPPQEPICSTPGLTPPYPLLRMLLLMSSTPHCGALIATKMRPGGWTGGGGQHQVLVQQDESAVGRHAPKMGHEDKSHVGCSYHTLFKKKKKSINQPRD